MAELIIKNLDIWVTAQTLKTSNRGRSAANQSLQGINKLRQLILELAVRGKLIPQNPDDNPASELLKKIAKERARLVKEGMIKKQTSMPEITNDEMPFELPKGWEWSRLIDYYDVRDGTHDSPKSTINGYPLVTSKNLYTGRLDLTNVSYISEEDHLKIIARSKVDKGDILFAMIGSIGNPVIVDVDIEFSIKNVALFKYYDQELSSPNYLQIFLKIASIDMKEKASGGVQSFVSLGNLRAYVMPIPPLAEQHRIVAKVDELMALCDQLEQQQADSNVAHEILVETLLDTMTNAVDQSELEQAWSRIANHFDVLFTTEHSIDRLIQTILQLAVMGKLVPQNPTDEPASELLKKIAKEKAMLVKEGKIKKQMPLPEISEDEKPFQLPKGWERARLQTIVFLLGDGLHGTPVYTPDTNHYFVNGNNLINGKIEIKPDTKTVSEEEMLKYKKVLTSNSILVSINGTLGNVAFYNGEEIMLGKSACYFNLSENIFKYFIKLVLNSPYFLEYAFHNATGTTIKNLGLKAMNEFPVLLPPLAEQHRIVTKVDELFAICDALKERINDAQVTQLNLADALVEGALK